HTLSLIIPIFMTVVSVTAIPNADKRDPMALAEPNADAEANYYGYDDYYKKHYGHGAYYKRSYEPYYYKKHKYHNYGYSYYKRDPEPNAEAEPNYYGYDDYYKKHHHGY
ncbi:2858_t:CDS:2, partial [Dentiscutata heterogama]